MPKAFLTRGLGIVISQPWSLGIDTNIVLVKVLFAGKYRVLACESDAVFRVCR